MSEPHTNENLPSDVKITLRDGRVTLTFRTARIVMAPEGAAEMARAIMEIVPLDRQRSD